MRPRSVRWLRVEADEPFDIGNYERIVSIEFAEGGGMIVFVAKEDDFA